MVDGVIVDSSAKCFLGFANAPLWLRDDVQEFFLTLQCVCNKAVLLTYSNNLLLLRRLTLSAEGKCNETSILTWGKRGPRTSSRQSVSSLTNTSLRVIQPSPTNLTCRCGNAITARDQAIFLLHSAARSSIFACSVPICFTFPAAILSCAHLWGGDLDHATLCGLWPSGWKKQSA